MSEPPSVDRRVTLRLLDSVQGHAVQTWEFVGQDRITIGRAADNDVVLADTKVSRTHAELVLSGDSWIVRSIGRNGTWVAGESIEESALSDRDVFRLAMDGPTVQFIEGRDSPSVHATVDVDDMDTSGLEFLTVDESQKAEELERLTGSESFQNLVEESRRLREETLDDDTQSG